jgi:hypothetical protein
VVLGGAILRGRLTNLFQTRLKTLVEPNLKRSLENRVDRIMLWDPIVMSFAAMSNSVTTTDSDYSRFCEALHAQPLFPLVLDADPVCWPHRSRRADRQSPCARRAPFLD